MPDGKFGLRVELAVKIDAVDWLKMKWEPILFRCDVVNNNKRHCLTN